MRLPRTYVQDICALDVSCWLLEACHAISCVGSDRCCVLWPAQHQIEQETVLTSKCCQALTRANAKQVMAILDPYLLHRRAGRGLPPAPCALAVRRPLVQAASQTAHPADPRPAPNCLSRRSGRTEWLWQILPAPIVSHYTTRYPAHHNYT